MTSAIDECTDSIYTDETLGTYRRLEAYDTGVFLAGTGLDIAAIIASYHVPAIGVPALIIRAHSLAGKAESVYTLGH